MQEFSILTSRQILEKTVAEYREQYNLLGKVIAEIEEHLRILSNPSRRGAQMPEIQYGNLSSDPKTPTKFELSKKYLLEAGKCLSISQLVERFQKDGHDKSFVGRLNGNLSATLGQKVQAKKLNRYLSGNIAYYGLPEWFDGNEVKAEYRQ